MLRFLLVSGSFPVSTSICARREINTKNAKGFSVPRRCDSALPSQLVKGEGAFPIQPFLLVLCFNEF